MCSLKKGLQVQLLFHQTVYMTWIFVVLVICMDLYYYKNVSKGDDKILMPLIFTFSLLDILLFTSKVYMKTARILIHRAVILYAASPSSLLLHA